MFSLSARMLRRYTLAALVLSCVAFAVMVKNYAVSVCIANALFVGGIVVFIMGCFRLAKYLGAFDLLVYANKMLLQKNDDEARGETNRNEVNRKQSYFAYTTQAKSKANLSEPLLIGGVYLLLSFLCTAFIQ